MHLLIEKVNKGILICLFLLVGLLLVEPSLLAARTAVLDKSGSTTWYGAYLMDSENGGVKLATLRRGLVVTLVREGQARFEVEVTEPSSALVIPHKANLTNKESFKGWVSPKFLKIISESFDMATETTTTVTSDTNTDTDSENNSDSLAENSSDEEEEEEEDSTTFGSMFSGLVNRFKPANSVRTDDSAVTAASSNQQSVKMAVVEKANAPNWYGAYIMDSESGGSNVATLRKGVTVEILETGTSRCKVRIVNSSDSGVIRNSSGSSSGEIVGWISNKFVNVIEEEPPVTAVVAEADDDGSSFFSDLKNSFTGFFSRGDDSSDEDSENGTEGNETEEFTGNGMGPEGSDPGNEPWREKLPNVYYVFADLAKDGNHFTTLASGRTELGSSSRSVVNHVEAMIKSDVSQTGRRGTVIVRVKISDSTQLLRILKDGKIPSGKVSSKKLYEEDELIGVACNIAGFCVIAHASTDGPVVGYKNKSRKQMTKKAFMSETGSGDWSMSNRIVKGARISFFGCNTANCQYYLDHSSVAHLLAGEFARKDVIVRGKKGIGNPNSSESAYANFGLNEEGVAVRLTPEKKDYTFYIPLNNFEDKKSGRKYVYEQLSVPYSTDEELSELKDYYKKRGLKTSVADGKIVVEAPKIGKISRSSEKDKLLLEVVRAINSREKTSRWDRFLNWTTFGDDVEEMTRARAIMPQLQKLLDDGELENIISEVRVENNGTLDENDVRIWFRIYFQNYEDKNDRGSISTRACLCHDALLTKNH